MFREQTLNGQEAPARQEGTEEEKKVIRDKAVRLKLFVYRKPVHDSIVKMLKAGAKQPIVTIGQVAADLMVKFEKDAGNINDSELLEALTRSLIGEIIMLALSAEVITDEQVTEDMVFKVAGIAQAKWEQSNPERVDKGRSQRMMSEGMKDPGVQQAVGKQAQRQALNKAPQQPAAAAPAQQPQPQQGAK